MHARKGETQMKKQWNILRSFSADNRGSGIVMVLVSMICVALMGASILFMSYTGLRLKVTERQASKDFYSAETAMDEIRAGLQTEVSEAIASSYKYVLETYSSGISISDRFEARFIEDLKKSGLFTNSGTQYDVAALASYVTNQAAVVVDSVSGGLVVTNGVENTLVLQGVRVTHTDANGYTTEIKTDITIDMPDFACIMSATSISGLPQHALIAKNMLRQNIGVSTVQIHGSAYAGSLVLGGYANSRMTISKGTLVCANDIQVSGSTENGRLVTEQLVKLWAGRIEVNSSSSVKLDGETRVLDDLELVGSAAEAYLSGSYYGFGDGTSDDGSESGKSNRSSAILVNGLNSTLDFSGLNRLMLAGRGYISDALYPGSLSSNTVGMLESVSVRSNQQMYLIDPSYLGIGPDYTDGVPQNPLVSNEQVPDIQLNQAGRELAATYNFTLRALYHSVPGTGNQWIHYYFMEFDDSVTASAYFEAYFAEHSDQMNSYLGADSNLNAAGTSTLGYTIRGKDGNYIVSQPNGVTFDCSGMRSTFNQLKKTLIDSNTMTTTNNPFDYIVDTDRVDAVNGTFTFADESGNIVGLVTDEDYAITSSENLYPDLRVIIASGNVEIDRDFTGLVICGGTIDIWGDVTMKADESLVIQAFNSFNTDDPTDRLSSYLLHGANETLDDAVDPGDVDGWNLDTLVTYRNWTKN